MTPAFIAAAALSVAFPAEHQQLGVVSETYVIGAVRAGFPDAVTVNSVTASVHASGAFIAMVPVVPGTNSLVVAAGDESLERAVRVSPPPDPAAPPPPSKPPRDPYADLGIPTNLVFAAKPPADRREPGQVTVMVDPGHGGRDVGAVTPHGWGEKSANLAQARAIRDALVKRGYKVVMTRDDDSFPELYDRPRRAWRERVDAFISVHHNATAPNRDPRLARHTVTYASNDAGLALAAAIQNRVGAVMAPVKDLGAQLKSLAVCRNPAIPSCLMEVDFINFPEGEAETFDAERRTKVAEAVADGLGDWLAAP